jgi:hypothetical protein
MPPATAPSSAGRFVCDREVFRDVIGHFASGVTVITTRAGDGKRHGMTAGAVSSLSLDPPMLVVCIHRGAPTCAAVRGAGVFGVNILSENDAHLAERFARPREDKLADVAMRDGASAYRCSRTRWRTWSAGSPRTSKAGRTPSSSPRCFARGRGRARRWPTSAGGSGVSSSPRTRRPTPTCASACDDHRELVAAYENADLAAAKAVIARHAERSTEVHRRAFAAGDPTVEETT